jgi:hypothetical protein
MHDPDGVFDGASMWDVSNILKWTPAYTQHAIIY